jgi:5-methylcytosine-specific restriction protein A
VTRLRTLSLAASVGVTRLSARVARLPTQLELGHRERSLLYRSARWRRERTRFLRLYPVCCTPGCGRRAVVVDHRDGHQRMDWRERFWDRSTWQPLCRACHSAKSARELAAWRDAGEGVLR